MAEAPPNSPALKYQVPAVVPKYFWRCLQVIGLLPVSYAQHNEHSNKSKKYDWCLLVYSLCLSGLVSVNAVVCVEKYVEIYLSRLNNLESFALITFICFLTSQCQVPVIFMLMWRKSKCIRSLLSHLRNPGIWNGDNRSPCWSMVAAPLALIWTALNVIAPFLHLRQTIQNVEDLSWEIGDNKTWTDPEPMFFDLLAVPYWVMVAGEELNRAFMLIVLTSSQMLTFLIILAIGKSFREQIRSLKAIPTIGRTTWRLCRLRTATLLGIIKETNEIFSWLNLAVCMQDLLNLIYYMTLLLEDTSPERKENELDHVDRVYTREIFLLQNVDPIIVSAVHLILRFTVCSYCSDQAQKLGFIAQQSGLQSHDPKVQDECRQIHCALSHPGNTTISAGGFAQINKEYLSALVGLFLTYFILVYQARDSKQEMRNLQDATKKYMLSLLPAVKTLAPVTRTASD